MKALKIDGRREVCWDEELIDKLEGVYVKMHKPEFRNVALECDKPWEGNTSGYFTVVPDENSCRLYYRGSGFNVDSDGKLRSSHKTTFCYAESSDGKQFERKALDIISFWGSKKNNILTDHIRDTMSFFKDTNPDCPPDELYKGLAAETVEDEYVLTYYKSADGVNFEFVGMLADDGAYDSLNVAFWDENSGQYFLFYRGLHTQKGEDMEWSQTDPKLLHSEVVRDVRVRASKDFKNWGTPKRIDFGPDKEDFELYTNQIQPYYRAKHILLGLPMRYIDRYKDEKNYKYLPDKKHRNQLIEGWGRTGTAMTDAMIMTSRDGVSFRRTEEAFMTAGIERGTNWYYGDGSICYGMAETASDIPGAPNEISIYMSADYRVNPVKLCRYAIRLDGFFSWHCDYKPGKVITQPFIFDGEELSINFSTSAAGSVRIRFMDAEGKLLDGYDSGNLFGDSIDRNVDFNNKLSEIAGREVRMEISMSDAELYAFQFKKAEYGKN